MICGWSFDTLAYHRGGIDLPMVDRSGRLVRNTMGPAIWRTDDTIAGNESLKGDRP
jgi:hypothetical protein